MSDVCSQRVREQLNFLRLLLKGEHVEEEDVVEVVEVEEDVVDEGKVGEDVVAEGNMVVVEVEEDVVEVEVEEEVVEEGEIEVEEEHIIVH
ncbi:hypothetical protein Pmani_023723 [Petrolisthes manimaculis]|uniref:Uncharacterized protein n=1 Tax=Petrolisthes manimaculis TaxID=1843537 RepID=A0AAE1PAJ5_9EUCA|nr:hypothetical protein Pmani_023723 [Petrolisthes manimaculis]